MLTQENGYGCGMYSVANVLNLENFITGERLELSKTGNNIGQLTNWLFQDGHSFCIDTLKYTGKLISLPKIDLKFESNVLYWPALISIQATKEKNHMIGIKVHNGGRSGQTIEVCDSLLDEPFYLYDWAELKYRYPKVYGLFSFRDFYNKDIFFCNLPE